MYYPAHLETHNFGYTHQKKQILINPELDKNRRKLYLFHELAHMAISIDENEAHKNFNSYFSITNTNSKKSSSKKDNNLKYYSNGWTVIEDGIVQEIAESCFYSSLNKERPAKTKQQDGYTLGKISFESNYDYYGIYQPLITAFGRTLKDVNTNQNDSDEVIQKNLCKKAFDNQFTSKVIEEYTSNSKQDKLYNLLGDFGVLHNRKLHNLGKSSNESVCSLTQAQTCYSESLKQMKQLEFYKPKK